MLVVELPCFIYIHTSNNATESVHYNPFVHRIMINRTNNPGSAISTHTVVEHWRAVIFVLCVAVFMLLASVRLHGAINPDSLWLDDQWVGALVKHASITELLEIMPPAPLGFLALLKAVTFCLGWGHWQLQLLPLAFGLAQVPLIGWIAWRATGRLSLGLVAAGLTIGSSTFLLQCIRIKQYTLEGLIVLVLIALAMACVHRPRAATFGALISAAILALLFSFTAAPAGMVIIDVLTLHLLLLPRDQTSISRRAAIIGCAAYNVITLTLIAMMHFQQPNELMFAFWSTYYMPIHDAGEWWSFMQLQGRRFFLGALAPTMGWLAYAAPIGIVLLLCSKQTRLIGLAFLLFYCGMFTLAALELYPIGGRRTDVFSYPITILAIIAAVWALSRFHRFIRFLPQIVLTIIIINMLLFAPGPSISYKRVTDRTAVEQINTLVQEKDGLIITPDSSWAVGCYGRWPVKLVRVAESTNGFIVVPRRERTSVVQEQLVRDAPRPDRSVGAEQIESLLETSPNRIWCFAIGHIPQWVIEAVESHGYIMQPTPWHDSRVLLFERAGEEIRD